MLIDTGFLVEAIGKNTNNEVTSYYAGGFVGESKSSQISNCHVSKLKKVNSDMQFGYSGGFVGSAMTGGLAEVAGNDTEIGSLVDVNGLLNAVSYLIPKFMNTTVSFVKQSSVEGAYAGGYVGELQSGLVSNEGNEQPYSVYGIESIKGQYYAGGFGGKVYSGALASSNGLSLLGSLNISIDDLISVLNVYMPVIKYAGVSSDGFIVEAMNLNKIDSQAGSAGGFIGYGSGVQVDHCDVYKLKNTKVTPPFNINSEDGSSYFDKAISTYAVTSPQYAGGYIGKMDIGSTASVGSGLSALSVLGLKDILSALDVVASTIENSNVYGETGGFSVLAAGEGYIGHAGGFAGIIEGSRIQNSSAYNFAYIIGQESAGGYVGTMQPGNVANAIGETSLLKSVVNTSDSLVSLLQSFIPMIYNSETTCIPCGGAVRANSASDTTRIRGYAGGYVGYNLGGRIKGNSNTQWANKEYNGEIRKCSVYRLRAVYGYEFAGGYAGKVECANIVDTGNIEVLFDLIELANPLQAVSAIYPVIQETAIYGPLRGLDVETWNSWVEHVAVNGAYGPQFNQLIEQGKVTNQEQLNQLINQYAYGYEIQAGRTKAGNLSSQGGVAGGYVGRMDGGIIEASLAQDLKSINALRSSGGFVGEMMSAGVAKVEGLKLAGIDILGSLDVLKTFVPVIKTSKTIGYQSGAVIQTTGIDLNNNEGNSGGFAGIIVGGQIEGSETDFCTISKLRSVKGSQSVGGFAGSILTGSALNANIHSQNGLLSGILSPLLSTGKDLAQVLNTTLSTIKYAKVEAVDDWGFTVNGTYTKLKEDNTQYASTVGGFVGMMSGAILGDSHATTDNIIVSGVRKVIGGEHVGGFVGLADVAALAQVSNETETSIIDLIKLGAIDVLDAFRPYIYHAYVNGSIENGLEVSANTQKDEGTLESLIHTGNAGGFAGSVLNGSIKDAKVKDLKKVNGLNYTGGFIGHMGKSGTIDLDKVSTDNVLSGLLNGTIGVLDTFGSHATNCEVIGIKNGFTVKSSMGKAPIAGGFSGLSDLAKIDHAHVKGLKQVSSDEIAGGFTGETTFEYLGDVQANSQAVNLVLEVVNEIIEQLYLGNLQEGNIIHIPLLGDLLTVSALYEGNLVSLKLLGIPITVALSKNVGDNEDLAIITIGDTKIELPCHKEGLNQDADTNIKVSLIKANRTKITNTSVTGITKGYDVFAGKATQSHNGTEDKGYAGGFVGFNNEGLLENNNMYYADTIRGTSEKVGPFTGTTSLDSVYEFNNIKGIEGTDNLYRIYRNVKDSFNTLITSNGTSFSIDQENIDPWNSYTVKHLNIIDSYNKLKDASMKDATTNENIPLNAYVTSSKAVLMDDTITYENETSMTPQPSEVQDPCDEFINLTINKLWEDLDNFDKLRPNHITITISRTYIENDIETTEQVEEYTNYQIKGNTDNTWQSIISGLPAYKTLQNEQKAYYTYSITETEIDGYVTDIVNSEDNFTFTITNTHTPLLQDMGGIGTWLFIITGCTIILAMRLLDNRRKKKYSSKEDL